MRPRPPRSTRYDPHLPYPTRVRSGLGLARMASRDLRPRLRRLTRGERIEDADHAVVIEIFVIIVVDLDHRRVGAGAHALDLGQREQPVGRRLALGHAAVLARRHHIVRPAQQARRSEEHTSELQSLMRISYAVFCLKKKKTKSHKVAHLHKSSFSNNTKRKTINNLRIHRTQCYTDYINHIHNRNNRTYTHRVNNKTTDNIMLQKNRKTTHDDK